MLRGGNVFAILISMAKDVKLKLAKRIRELRREYNYTKQMLAELASVDYCTVTPYMWVS